LSINLKRFDRNWLNISVLIFIWILLIIIINPIGEFPFADDFAYSNPVEHLLKTGEIRLTDWSSMTLVAHIYIGAFFTSLFGFSFSVLRFIGLISGITGVIGIYCLTNLLSNKKMAFLVSLLTAFHPYYYLLSYSFDTDVPFFVFIIWSIYFYTKVIRYNKIHQLVFAIILNIIALLIRDLGIIIPPAFAIAYMLKHGISIRSFIRLLSPIILILLTFIFWRIWIEYYHGITKSIDFSRNKMLTVWTSGIGYLFIIYSKNILYSIIYLGIYGIPLIILLLKEYYSEFSKKFRYLLYTLISIFTPILIILLLKWDKIYTDVGDYLTTHLVGHNFFWVDVHNPSKESAFFYPSWLLIIIASIGLIAGICLLIIVFHKGKDYFKIHNYKFLKTQNGAVEFISLIILFYLFIIFSQYMVNRYLFLPLILIYIILTNKLLISKRNSFIMKFIFLLFLFYNIYNSISAAHDMMSFNRTRWEALNYLNNELNIKPEQIDGGFEYNAWYFYNYDYIPTEGKNWWFVQDDEYVVSWGKINGYETIKEYVYYRWFPPGFNGHIFVGKRLNKEE
jgi:hypothetical protein